MSTNFPANLKIQLKRWLIYKGLRELKLFVKMFLSLYLSIVSSSTEKVPLPAQLGPPFHVLRSSLRHCLIGCPISCNLGNLLAL